MVQLYTWTQAEYDEYGMLIRGAHYKLVDYGVASKTDTYIAMGYLVVFPH